MCWHESGTILAQSCGCTCSHHWDAALRAGVGRGVSCKLQPCGVMAGWRSFCASCTHVLRSRRRVLLRAEGGCVPRPKSGLEEFWHRAAEPRAEPPPPQPLNHPQRAVLAVLKCNPHAAAQKRLGRRAVPPPDQREGAGEHRERYLCTRSQQGDCRCWRGVQLQEEAQGLRLPPLHRCVRDGE